MLGFTAKWESGEPTADMTELTDVRWFEPDEVLSLYKNKSVSISWKLIENFLDKHLDGKK